MSNQEDFERWYMQSQRIDGGYACTSAQSAWRAWQHLRPESQRMQESPGVYVKDVGIPPPTNFVVGMVIVDSSIRTGFHQFGTCDAPAWVSSHMSVVQYLLDAGVVVCIACAPEESSAWLHLIQIVGGQMDRVISNGSKVPFFAAKVAFDSSTMGRPCVALVEYDEELEILPEGLKRCTAAYWPTHITLDDERSLPVSVAAARQQAAIQPHDSAGMILGSLSDAFNPHRVTLQANSPGPTGISAGVRLQPTTSEIDAMYNARINAVRMYAGVAAIWGNICMDGTPV